MPSDVLQVPPASPAEVAAYYSRRLSFETDCWDVHEAFESGPVDFVLADARNPDSYARGHLPKAINLWHRLISEETLAAWPDDTVFVVYCDGPHCNAADKAAVKLASLGRRCKVMIGGRTGWLEEGFTLEP